MAYEIKNLAIANNSGKQFWIYFPDRLSSRCDLPMWLDLPHAISIYARYFRARHGLNASRIAVEKAQQLKEKGDVHGHHVWNEVAREIERLTVTSSSSKGAE
jgi:hypothetical protein